VHLHDGAANTSDSSGPAGAADPAPATTDHPDAVAGAEIAGTRQRLRVAYASTVPALLARAEDALTTPSSDGAVPTVLRWCTRNRLHTAVTMVTLLSLGAAPATVALAERDGGLEIAAGGPDWQQVLRLTTQLQPQAAT
jgi:hypothetical protein